MKSKVTTHQPVKGPLQYPILLIYNSEDDISGNGLVVLFDSDSSGMCVASGRSNNKVGSYKDCWVSTDNESWQRLDGKVELSN